MTPKREISPWAVASNLCGCAGAASLLLAFIQHSGILAFGILACIPAVVCGHIARAKIRRSDGALTGDGRAFAGLVTGYLVIVFAVIPAYSPPKHHPRRAQAKADIDNIVAAVKQYHTEYGKYPIADEGQDESSHDITFGDGTRHNSELFQTLRSLPEGPDKENRLNPRKIVFFEGRQVLDPSKPSGGFADQDQFSGKLKGSYFDPWGHEYLIRIHGDTGHPFVAADGTRINGNVIVWSLGPDGKQGTEDDVVSWK